MTQDPKNILTVRQNLKKPSKEEGEQAHLRWRTHQRFLLKPHKNGTCVCLGLHEDKESAAVSTDLRDTKRATENRKTHENRP